MCGWKRRGNSNHTQRDARSYAVCLCWRSRFRCGWPRSIWWWRQTRDNVWLRRRRGVRYSHHFWRCEQQISSSWWRRWMLRGEYLRCGWQRWANRLSGSWFKRRLGRHEHCWRIRQSRWFSWPGGKHHNFVLCRRGWWVVWRRRVKWIGRWRWVELHTSWYKYHVPRRSLQHPWVGDNYVHFLSYNHTDSRSNNHCADLVV